MTPNREIRILPDARGIAQATASEFSKVAVVWWPGDETDRTEENAIRHSTLSRAYLQEPVDPESAEVTYVNGRVWLRLSRVDNEHSSSEPDTPEVNRGPTSPAQVSPTLGKCGIL